jgi:peptidoglycan/xylan/chitin deacetylase (PgdA/CDA1 family)
MRGLVRSAASSRASAAVIGILERFDRGRGHLLPVLGYHRVADPTTEAGAHAGLCVPPQAFQEQLDAVSARHDVISLTDLLEVRRGHLRLPRRALLITFDDGYDDFASTAWPMLRERSLPAALFVPTAYPDTERWFWWDRLAELVMADTGREAISSPVGHLPVRTDEERRRAFAALRTECKRMSLAEVTGYLEKLADEVGAAAAPVRTLGWEVLRRLAAEGVAIAPHSRTHPILTTLSGEELDEELRGSRSAIEREIGVDTPSFAYPSGAHDARVIAAAEAAGYELAFATRRGINDLRRPRWMSLARINVGSRTSSTLVRAQVGSWMAFRGGR